MPPPKKPKNGPTSVEQFLSQDELNVLVKDKSRPRPCASLIDDDVSNTPPLDNKALVSAADAGSGGGGSDGCDGTCDNNNVIVVAPVSSPSSSLSPSKSSPPPPPTNATTASGVPEPGIQSPRQHLVTSGEIFTTASSTTTPLSSSPTSDRQLPPLPVGGNSHKQQLKQPGKAGRRVPLPPPPPSLSPQHPHHHNHPPQATVPSLLSQETSSPPHATKATGHASASGLGDDGGNPLLLSCSNDAPKSRNTSSTTNYLRAPLGLPAVSQNKTSSITNCSSTGSFSSSSSTTSSTSLSSLSSSTPLSSSVLTMPSLLSPSSSVGSPDPNSSSTSMTSSPTSAALSSKAIIAGGNAIMMDVNRNKYGRSSSLEDATKGASSMAPVTTPKGSILHKLFTSSTTEKCDNKSSNLSNTNNSSNNGLREQQQPYHQHPHHHKQQQHHIQSQTNQKHHLWPSGFIPPPGQHPTPPPPPPPVPGSVFTSESLLASLNYRLSTSNSLASLVNQQPAAWLSPFETSRFLVAGAPLPNPTTSTHRIATTTGGSGVAGTNLLRRSNSAATTALDFPAAALAAANFSSLQQQQQQQEQQQQHQHVDGRSILAALITSQKRNPVSPDPGLSSPSSDDVFMLKGSPSPLRGSNNISSSNSGNNTNTNNNNSSAPSATTSSSSPSAYLSSPFLRQPSLSLQTRNIRGGSTGSSTPTGRTPNHSSSGRTESAPVYLHSAFQLHPSTTATSNSIRKNKSTSSLPLLPTSPHGNNPVLSGLPPLLSAKMSMFSSTPRTSSSPPPLPHHLTNKQQQQQQQQHHHNNNNNPTQGHPHHNQPPPPLHQPLPPHHHLTSAVASAVAANTNEFNNCNNTTPNHSSTFRKTGTNNDTNKINNKNPISSSSDPGEPYDLSVKSSSKLSDDRSDSKDSLASSLSARSPPYPISLPGFSRKERDPLSERPERSPSESSLATTTHRSPSTSEGAGTVQGIESDDSSCDINVTSPVPPSSLLRLMTASLDSATSIRGSPSSNTSTRATPVAGASTPVHLLSVMDSANSIGSTNTDSSSKLSHFSSCSSPRVAATSNAMAPFPPPPVSSSNLAALLSMSTSPAPGTARSSSSSLSSSAQLELLRPAASVKEEREDIDMTCNNNSSSSSSNNSSNNNNNSSTFNVPYCSSGNLLPHHHHHHHHSFLQQHPHLVHHQQHQQDIKMTTITTTSSTPRGIKRYHSSGGADGEPSDCKSPKEEVRMVSPSSCLQALPLGGAGSGGGDGQQSATAGSAASAHSLQAATSTTPEPVSGGSIPHNFLLEMHGHSGLGSSPSSSHMKTEVTGAVPGSSIQAKLCQVCNDNASGFHYGVWSCEGCKAFFKRSIQGPVDYICPATNTCTIDKHRRKSCQACRLRRCYEVGMNKGSQRKERKSSGSTLTKGKRCRADSTDSTINSTNNGTSSSKAVKRIRSASILEALQRADLPVLESQHNHNLPPTRVHLLNTLLNLINQELHNLIHWARNVPGYTHLTLADQMHLIRCCWMELLLLNCAFRSMEHEGRKLVFAHDFHLDRQQWACTGMGAVLEQVSAVSEQMVLYGLSKEEMVLLQATVLVNAEVRRLEGFLRIQDMRQTILDVFMEVANRHQPYGGGGAGATGNSSRQAPSILLLLTHIRQAGERGITYLQHLKMEGAVVFCDLINEMLETNNAWGTAGGLGGGNGNDTRRHLQQQQQHPQQQQHHHLSHPQHLQSSGPPPPSPVHPPPHSSSHHQQPPPHPSHHHSGGPSHPPPAHPMSSD